MLLIASSLILVLLILLDWPDEYTRVIFCDVGQGDAIIIQKGFTQVLIDSGSNNQVSDCLNKYLPFWDRDIEIVIATHADKDHIGGFRSVLNEFFVNQMTIGGLGKKTGVFSTFRELVLREENEGMILNLLTDNSQYQIDDNLFLYNYITRVEGAPNELYDPEITETQLWDRIELQEAWLKKQKLDLNTLSVVNILQYGKVSFLFTGDLDIEGEQALLERGLIKDVDVLKVGHHGSKTSTSDEFLRVVSPEVSIISVGENNNYRHPSPQVLVKLEDFGSKVLRTDQLGDIVIVTDGQSYWLE